MTDEPSLADRLIHLLAGRWSLPVLDELAGGDRRYLI
jgi:hypothetical protein